MKINSIEISNYKGIHKAEIIFNGQSAILFGINGSGKSSILRAINAVFSTFLNRLVKNRFKQAIMINKDDVRFGTSICTIIAKFSFQNQDYSDGVKIDKNTNRKLSLNTDLTSIMQHYNSLYDEDDSNNVNIPIYANYGVNRLVIDIPLRIRKSHVFEPLYTYQNAIQSTVDFRTFFEWFRNREDYENEVKVSENLKYVDSQLEAVRKAVSIMLEGFSGLCIKRNPLAMKIYKGSVMLNIAQLSDGEKCTLALIGDLARRIAMANPKMKNPLKGEGIVLIDEIELHLHPTWQRRIVATLRDIFPNVQFILSTHSPQVLGDIPDDMKVFYLENTKSGVDITEMASLRGWDVNSILENNMQTSSQNLDIRGKVSHAYDLIEEKKYDEAKKIVDELETRTNSKNPDVVELRFLIHRGELKREAHK